MKIRRLLIPVVILCLLAALLPAIGTVAVIAALFGSPQMSGAQSDCTGTATAQALTVDAASLPQVPGYSELQLSNAAIIMQVGAETGVGERGQLIGLMTAMQEDQLGADPSGQRPDPNGDAGVFQLRTYPGWHGSLRMVLDTNYAAHAFFEGVTAKSKGDWGSAGGGAGYGHLPGLKDIKGWESKSLTQAAQAVQGSAFPDAYAKHEAEARKLMAALAGVPVADAQQSLTDPALGCGAAQLPAVTTDGLPSQAELASDSSAIACPEGTTDLGVADGGFEGKHIPIRLCSITGTVCTGTDCGAGSLGGKARGEVVLNSRVAPFFIQWLADVRKAGLNPEFASSFRSWSSQSAIWHGGTNGNAAQPGLSNHQMGAAVDIAGFSASYSRNNCTGKASDGSCMSNEPQWATYHEIGLQHGATFLDSEFWHLEWIITHANRRQIPFIPAA